MRVLNVQTPSSLSTYVFKCFFNQMLAMHNEKYLMYSLALRSKNSIIRTTTFWKNLEANYKSCLLIVMDKLYGIIYTFICTLITSLRIEDNNKTKIWQQVQLNFLTIEFHFTELVFHQMKREENNFFAMTSSSPCDLTLSPF